MVIISASNLTLPIPSSLSSQSHTTSILFESSSLSLALTHSDSSLSLYPSFSSSLPLPIPQTLIPPPSSSSTFLQLQKNPNFTNPNSTVLFLVCGPHRAGSQILIRFYVLDRNGSGFSRVKRVICGSRSDFLRFEEEFGGVLINAKHGVSVKVFGSVNYFAVYSVSGSKVWVFAVKMIEDDDDGGGGLKLMRCAVIRCLRPVWSLSISFGLLILGEENGVRIFGLRRLVKSNVVVKKAGKSNLNSKSSWTQLPNGDHHGKRGGGDRGGKCRGGDGVLEGTCNCDLEGKIEKHGVAGR